MAYSEAQNRATQKYVKKSYDRIYISLPKGRKEEFQAAADTAGESLTRYIIRATEMRMEQDGL